MNNKSTFTLITSLLLSSLASPALANDSDKKATQGGYFEANLGAARFDLPGYKDGFGVVGLAPASGPFLAKGENQSGESLSLTGGIVTQYPIDLVDGLLFFEGSAFYSQSDESYSSQLGSDSDGNNIRFALFNGSNGYNTTSATPANFRLKSALDYFGGHLAIGVQTKTAEWNTRYQVGPQLIKLKQDFTLLGDNPNFVGSFYNRNESLDTEYLGLRFALSGDRALTEKLHIETGIGVSLLSMDADYEGADEAGFGGGSSLSRSANESTYGADLKLALRYAFTPRFTVGISYGLNYLDKAPEIVHATGAIGNGTFVPARLDTGHMLMQHAGFELSHRF